MSHKNFFLSCLIVNEKIYETPEYKLKSLMRETDYLWKDKASVIGIVRRAGIQGE